MSIWEDPTLEPGGVNDRDSWSQERKDRADREVNELREKIRKRDEGDD